jgi:hypothetical protein
MTTEHAGSGGPDLGAELARTLRELLEVLPAMRASAGGWPGAASPAMGELEAEAGLAGPFPWGAEPVMAARNLAVALSVAAADHTAAFANAVERYAPYAPAVAARAAAEACGQIARLCEERIGARDRVRRMVNERLRSFADERKVVARVPALAGRLAELDATVAGLRSCAESLGYPLNAWYLTPDPPGMGELVSRLFDPDVGALMYHLMSSAGHGRVAGLMRSVSSGPTADGFSAQTGVIRMRPHDAAMQASALLICMQEAIGALAAYSGWDDGSWTPRWTAAAAVAETARRQFATDD